MMDEKKEAKPKKKGRDPNRSGGLFKNKKELHAAMAHFGWYPVKKTK